MDYDKRLEFQQTFEGELWEARLNETYKSGGFCEWVSGFHPQRLPCRFEDTNLRYGSYNAGCKIAFDDGTIWLVRFPRPGHIHPNYADEKVAVEVAVIKRIRRDTTIPVPNIITWGTAAENPLHLGPFIIMDFIQAGATLNDLFINEKGGSRLLRDDISDEDIKIVYQQFANFMLQLFNIDFDHIGGFEGEDRRFCFKRPLTLKAHDILQIGGVDTFGDRHKGFSSTMEYFQFVIEQDWEQLVRQPNSTFGRYHAMSEYELLTVLKSLIPRFVHEKYDKGKFKIICDDLGLANLMVRSRDDLTIIGVIDLEWSYIGPAQLFGSAPWWLLMDRPINKGWDCDEGEPYELTARYFKYLEIFKSALWEEEAKMTGCEGHELSSLVEWSQRSGAMWVHMILSSGFNGSRTFPWTKLREFVGRDEWKKAEREVDEDEVEKFGLKKVQQQEQYDRELDMIEARAALVDEGKLTKEEFIATANSFYSDMAKAE